MAKMRHNLFAFGAGGDDREVSFRGAAERQAHQPGPLRQTREARASRGTLCWSGAAALLLAGVGGRLVGGFVEVLLEE